MAMIIVTTTAGDAPQEGETIELVEGQALTIGRDDANRLPLPDIAGLSRRHCRIAPREGGAPGWEVADLGSTNKTRVNGNVVQQRTLSHGDVIEIGNARLVYEDPEEAARLASLEREGVCFLEWVTGDHKGERVPLAEKRTRIGRRDSNSLTLDDRMVSGHHAEIDRDLNGYTIRDLGSTNGTLVNGEPISESLLTHGSRLRIGNSRFAFKDPSMKDVEVELAHFDEDEGWGMMGELDLSRARGSKIGLMLVVLLFIAAGAGGWWLATHGDDDGGPIGRRGRGLVPNAGFDDVDLPWSASREEGVDFQRKESGGKPGAYLATSNGGEGLGPVRITCDEAIETAGKKPLRIKAHMRGRGDGTARFVVIWESDPTDDERKAGVLDLERTDVLLAHKGSWKPIDQTRVPPVWAKFARVGIQLDEGASADVDNVDVVSVDVESGGEAGERPHVPVPTFRRASIDSRASLDLLANRTLLLGGVHPVVRTPDGEVLDVFEAAGPIQADGQGFVLEGAFQGPDEPVSANLAWRLTEEGLRFTISSDGAEAVGLTASAPAQHVGGTVNVLGDFLPQSFPTGVGERLERVSRTMLGAPSSIAGGRSTLVSIVQDQDRKVATLEFMPSLDSGFVTFRHWLQGQEGALDVVTDFTRQKEEAEAELRDARHLMDTAPGRAIAQLRDVAGRYPFDTKVRDAANEAAGKLEVKAREEIGALRQALLEFRVYRSSDALEHMLALAERMGGQYPPGEGTSGAMETDVAKLVEQAGTARDEYEISLAGPGVDRLERLATLLTNVKGYGPVAAVYTRALVERYSHLEDKAEDIKRRLTEARARLGELQGNADVKNALPPAPVPKPKQGS